MDLYISDTALKLSRCFYCFTTFISHIDKSAYNQARLRRQIAQCNSLVNKDKANYFRNSVRENANDSKKLWQVLRSALHSSPEAVLPSHESKKGLADWFVTFFNDKIAKIRNSFSSSDSFTLRPHLMCLISAALNKFLRRKLEKLS